MLIDDYHTETPLQLPGDDHAWLQAFVEAIPDGAIVTDGAGTILHTNTQIEEMFGYNHRELDGKPVTLLTSLEEMDTDTTPPELIGWTKDGHEFPIDVTLQPMDVDGEHHYMALIHNSSALAQERDRTETLLRFIRHRLIEREERERRELAQLIHDGPLQELHSLDFRLVALARQAEMQDAQGALQELHTMLQQVSHQLRDLCQELRPPTLSSFGVGTAIRSFVYKLREQHPDLRVRMELADDGQRLSPHQRIALYRILHHAVQNVVQHADTDTVDIRLQLSPEDVVLEIEDEGVGFELPHDWIGFARAGKFGLIECVERAQAVGGRLDVYSRPGGGTQVRVTVPLEESGSTEQ